MKESLRKARVDPPAPLSAPPGVYVVCLVSPSNVVHTRRLEFPDIRGKHDWSNVQAQLLSQLQGMLTEYRVDQLQTLLRDAEKREAQAVLE